MPTVTVIHTEKVKIADGTMRIRVEGVAVAADGEEIKAGEFGLSTIEHALLQSNDPNVNIGRTIVNPGSYDNSLIVHGSDVSGTTATSAGSTEFSFILYGF